jgi:holin-like protein
MLRAITILLVFQLVGEILVRLLSLPIPGPVIGMVFLFVVLLVRGDVPADLRSTAQTILANLSLLFVPAGVGVIVHASLIERELLPLAGTLVLSTYLTLLVTALTMVGLLRISTPRTKG